MTVLFNALDELKHVCVLGVIRHDVVVVLQFAHLNTAAGGRIPAILVVENHRLAHERFEFRDRMETVEYVVVIVAGIVPVINEQPVR